jgi:hypothetical protein
VIQIEFGLNLVSELGLGIRYWSTTNPKTLNSSKLANDFLIDLGANNFCSLIYMLIAKKIPSQ